MQGTPFDFIQTETRRHRLLHGCGAYTFEDGPGLIQLAKAHAPAWVLELGTALGFTACCLASVGPDTRVDTIDYDSQHVSLARESARQTGFGRRITVHQGDFLDVMATLEARYDMAFFDGFAPNERVMTRLIELLKASGILICANLRLASESDKRWLREELTYSGRWEALGMIEKGGTRAFRRRIRATENA